jgi:hypothetical protein
VFVQMLEEGIKGTRRPRLGVLGSNENSLAFKNLAKTVDPFEGLTQNVQKPSALQLRVDSPDCGRA